jgi:branched-chain amino acid transport system ATP-binding protein
MIPSEINRLISLVGIEDIGNPLVCNMPHGQQQWLEIAMSLASQPKLLLLDEPAAGMGPEETEFTSKIVKRINEQGTTIIFIDHDMDFVSKIARRTTVLHYGKIFAEGTFDEIHNNEDVINIYLGKV